MTRKLIAIAAAAAAASMLQGCFPLVATGVGATALVATDRRTTGIYIEDEAIELKSLRALSRFQSAHVNATSYNRRVLLTGEAPSEEAKKQIEEAVRGIENVKEVVNEIAIAGASSYASRGADSLITSNVKARMVNNGKFSPMHVKVVTEASVVYLLGLVDRQEADAAVEVARTTSGVSRVVKAFEYLP
jgi:osmotically-inducible protein OsmY